MKKDLISIVTPCYNGGAFVHRLLDSILEQSYPYVEMFLIDDGSTDNTSEVVKSYIPKFQAKGYKLEYIYQENSGQSAVLNNGLKLINGEYFTWPDADDFYAKNNTFEEMIASLSKTDESIALVRGRFNQLNEDTLELRSQVNVGETNTKETNLFLDSLFCRNKFTWPPIHYMVKAKALFNVIPNKSIYTEKNAGQNWQLLLPILYKYKVITLSEIFYNVLIRDNSHSRGQYKSIDSKLDRISSYENTILSTLDSIEEMPELELNKYKKEIMEKYAIERFKLCFNRKYFKKWASVHKKYNYAGISRELDIMAFLSKIPLVSKATLYLLKIFKRLRR